MKKAIFVLLVLPFFSIARASVVCEPNDQSVKLIISDYVETEGVEEFMTTQLSAQVFVVPNKVQAAVRSFTIKGTREFMPAGFSDQLKNEQEGLSIEEAFNGSILNSWEQPLTVILKGQNLNCLKLQ
jgi:hypothetical protein